MARRPARFTQADVTRLIKGAMAAGITLDQVAVKIMDDGPVLLFGDRKSVQDEDSNEWDEVLKS